MNEQASFAETGEQPTDVAALLSGVAQQANVPESEADAALCGGAGVEQYQNLVRKRAGLIADLPATLADYEQDGGNVPAVVKDWADSQAALAQRMIENGGTFGMSTLLITWGSQMGDPNQLEQLIIQLEADEQID